MHIMIDIETMGTRPTAPIVSFGAVAFDADGIHHKFYRAVDLNSAVVSGAVIEPGTVLWWLDQSDDARAALTTDIVEPIGDVLVAFQEFVAGLPGGVGALRGVWGNGATFDNVLVAEAYKRLGMLVPWPFWKDRCYRTVRTMFPAVELVRNGTHHHALADAETQAQHLIAISESAGGLL
jgi:exodeoxyribonuclease VIII